MSLSRRDFSYSLAAGDIAPRDAGVAALARDWPNATLAAPRLKRMLCWGLADHYSWLQDCLPFNEQLQPKPLRAAIASALRAMPAR